MNISRNSFLKSAFLVIFSSLIILLVSCNGEQHIPPPEVPTTAEPFIVIVEDVRNAATGECEIGEEQNGNTSTVIVIPEIHTSVIGQIQSSIALTKLHYSNNLNDIILEGYLIDGPEIDYSNYYKVCGNDENVIQSVAVKLLGEGEISAAEFMKLVFKDVNIYPTEFKENYNKYTAPDNFYDILNSYIDNMYEQDPNWTNDIIEEINAAYEVQTLEKIMEVMEKLDNYSLDKIRLAEDDRNGMQTYIKFLKGRIASSGTIVTTAVEKSEDPNIPLSVMIIGAAHKDGVLTDLSNKSVSHIVLTPLVFNAQAVNGKYHPSDMDMDTFLEKGSNKSVLTMGIAKTLDDILNPLAADNQAERKDISSIKPEPIINRNPMVRARIELYAFTEKICFAIFEGGSPPEPFPPAALNLEALDGEFVSINPAKIEIIDEPNNEKSVFFEANIKPYNTPIYVKAVLNKNEKNKDLIEQLKYAEEKCKNEYDFRKQAEDNDGVIRLDKVSFIAGLDQAVIISSTAIQ